MIQVRPGFGGARGWALAVVLAAGAAGGVGCLDTRSVTVPMPVPPPPPPWPGRGPALIVPIPTVEVLPGRYVTVNVQQYFHHPDGVPFRVTARAIPDTGRAKVRIEGTSLLQVLGLWPGDTRVAVTATDTAGRANTQGFTITVTNRAPTVRHEPPARDLAVGDTLRLGGAAYFDDPDREELTFEASSSDASVVSATVDGRAVELVATGRGRAAVALAATDPGGLRAEASLEVSVRPAPGTFDIALHFTGDDAEARRAAVRAGAELWMGVLAAEELPDVAAAGAEPCHGLRAPDPDAPVDDLLLLVEFAEIDGPGGVYAQAGPCALRDESLLPFMAAAYFDTADLDAMIASGDAEELAAHEIAHALGFGLLWPRFDLIRDPSFGFGGDPHFAGPLAIAAFDEAGGREYGPGKKVPVENIGGAGTVNFHWRGSVLGGELMRPLNAIGAPDALSAITLQSLADLGYEVDLSLADAYALPSQAAAHRHRTVHLGEDILAGPLRVAPALPARR